MTTGRFETDLESHIRGQGMTVRELATAYKKSVTKIRELAEEKARELGLEPEIHPAIASALKIAHHPGM